MGMSQKYRHEDKFLIGFPQYRMLRSQLAVLMHCDSNASADGSYKVRSLYFDTMENRDFYEKEAGIEVRRKIRLRTYSAEAERAKLEIKNRRQNGIYKEVVSVSRQEAERLIINPADCEFLREHSVSSAHLYRYFMTDSYRPVLMIEYDREAYTLPFFQIRITFDQRIRACRKVSDFWQKEPLFTSVIPSNEIVLEVKYNDMIPDYLRRLLSLAESQSMSISKYYLARNLLG